MVSRRVSNVSVNLQRRGGEEEEEEEEEKKMKKKVSHRNYKSIVRM